MFRWSARLLAALAAAQFAPPLAEAALSRVVWVTRHGERERLWKNALTMEEGAVLTGEGGPRLTPRGIQHLREVGAALRQRYMQPSCDPALCLVGNLASGMYFPAEVRVESSGLERSLGSAMSLHASLFPGGSVGNGSVLAVPIYSRQDPEDFVIRAYSKCPTLNERVQVWHGSADFLAKNAETRSLRILAAEALARLASGTNSTPTNVSAVPLLDWYNAYDDLNVQAEAGKPLLSDSDMREVARLAAWVESRKVGINIAGNLCGGTLLGSILRRAFSASQLPSLLHYSAHYSNIICLLGTLGVAVDSGNLDDLWLQDALPGPGSVLALEVTDGPAASQMVRMRYWDGNTSAPTWRDVRLPCPGGACSLADFLAEAGKRAIMTDQAWCEACKNREVLSCKAYAQLATRASQMQSDSDSEGGKFPQSAVAVIVPVSLAVGLLGLVAGCCLTQLSCFKETCGRFYSPSGHRELSDDAGHGMRTVVGAAM